MKPFLSPEETKNMLGTKDEFEKYHKNKIEEVKCPKCGMLRFDELDIDNIQEFGECLSCEDIRLDTMSVEKDSIEE